MQKVFLANEIGKNISFIEYWIGDYRDVFALCSGIEFEELSFYEKKDKLYNPLRMNIAQDIMLEMERVWMGDI